MNLKTIKKDNKRIEKLIHNFLNITITKNNPKYIIMSTYLKLLHQYSMHMSLKAEMLNQISHRKCRNSCTSVSSKLLLEIKNDQLFY